MLEKRTGLAILWQSVLDHVLTRAESKGIEASTSSWEPSTTKAANVITTARPVFSHRHSATASYDVRSLLSLPEKTIVKYPLEVTFLEL